MELCFPLSVKSFVTSLILHASIAEITAQLLSLCVACLILSEDDSIINQDFFVQINRLEVRAECSLNESSFSHYFIFILFSDNRNRKKYQWKQFYWEFSRIKMQYVGTERQTNVIINNNYTFVLFRSRAALSFENVNRLVSVNCSVQRKRRNGNLLFLFLNFY